MKKLAESEGRHLFGTNVQGYNDVRPKYPEALFDSMVRQGALSSDIDILEIGPGTGLATAELVKHNLQSLTLVEPDSRFGDSLKQIVEGIDFPNRVVHEAFEAIDFGKTKFDLVVIATTFHWLEPVNRVQYLSKITKAGGYVALLWNVFGDAAKADPFHDATTELLGQLPASPSGGPSETPFALRKEERIEEFTASDSFELSHYEQIHWEFVIDAKGVCNLYETFSQISRLELSERENMLDELELIAREQFNNKVTRNVISPLYLFQRN